MNWSVFLILLLMFVGVFLLYTFLNISYLSKLKVNQWVILAVAVVFIIASLIVPNFTSNKILTNISVGVFFFFFLWFLDARKSANIRKRNEEPTRVIKPKANPNRVKQFKEEDIIKTEDISKKTKKKRKK